MVKWDKLNEKYKTFIQEKHYTYGAYYRAFTRDGDTYDGILTYISKTTIELQIGNSFKTFNRGLSRIVKLSNPEGE